MRLQSWLGVFLFLFLPIYAVFAQPATYTVETLPNPKNTGTGYVSNPDGIISAEAVNTLNRIATQIEDSTSAQIAIAVVQSIGQENPKMFATTLFEKWGIGQAENDNGLLVLTVMDQRRTELETGYGMEGVLPDAIAYRVLMEELVPEFQQGNYGNGFINLLSRIQTILQDPEAAKEITANRDNTDSDAPSLLIVLGIYLLISFILTAFLIGRIYNVLRSREELYDKYLDLKKIYWAGLFLFLPYIFIYIFLGRKLRKLRKQARFSRTTGEPLRLLSEEEEDQYLEQGQITEEAIGSVDYDVWVNDTGDDILVLRYKKRFTRYTNCPACDYLTYYHANTKTVRRATYSASGLQHKIYQCKNCHHRKVKPIILPRKQRSSSGGGGGIGGSSGSSSWGGGSSGGGGAGVSW